MLIVNLRQSETRLHKSVWHKLYVLAVKVPGLFEVYSAFKVGNIQDYDNEKRSRSWRIGTVSFSTA